MSSNHSGSLSSASSTNSASSATKGKRRSRGSSLTLMGIVRSITGAKREKEDEEMETGLEPGSRRGSLFGGSSGSGKGALRLLILPGILLLFYLYPPSFLFSSYDSPTTHAPMTFHNNLLSQTLQNLSLSNPPPFAFCPVFGPTDPVATRRGQAGLLKSRMHLGTGERIGQVVRKAMRGEPVSMAVLGGSVSACHGAGDAPLSPSCYPSKFFSWWTSIFPHPDSSLANGSERKTDSAYYAFCSKLHLPDEVDLVIIEVDAADPNDSEYLGHFELLIRSLLMRPEQPAVIILGHFSPQIQSQHGFVGPELLHDIVAAFYDVPHVSVKGLLYTDYMAEPSNTRAEFYADPILANPTGHDLLSDILISYFQSQICSGWASALGHGFLVPQPSETGNVTAVPPNRIGHRPSDVASFRELEPFCVTANDLVNPLPPSLFYGSGWKVEKPKAMGDGDRFFWWSDIGGSRIRVPVTVGAGRVGVYFLQGGDNAKSGEAVCWVDDNTKGAIQLDSLNRDLPEMVPTLVMIDEGVTKGEHYVECELVGDKGSTVPAFKILGVFAT